MMYREQINTKQFYYKLGVMCGQTLYYTYKFDNFENMMQAAEQTFVQYKSDMQHCNFIIQAFKNNSYDFASACFSQVIKPVQYIDMMIGSIAKEILSDYYESAKEM